MKTCSRKALAITELALGTLDVDAEKRLRDHLEHCAGCREYFDQMRRVTGALGDAPVRTDIESSDLFHRKVVSRLEANNQSHLLRWPSLLKWRFAGPALALFASICAILVFWPRQPKVQEFVQIPTVIRPKAEENLNPTLANYQQVANRSPDSLDNLIARQSKKRSASVPVYRASTLFTETTFD